MKICSSCGKSNRESAKFCVHCGNNLAAELKDDSKKISKVSVEHTETATEEGDNERLTNVGSGLGISEQIGRWAGNTGDVNINWRSFFGQVFKHHTTDEAEKIFIAGTKSTTPSLTEISVNKVQPWVFSRILLLILFVTVLIYGVATFNPINIITVELMLGVAVPFSALVLFYETNIYQNVSFYQTMKIFLVGGLSSLIVTLLIDSVISNGSTDTLFESFLSAGFPEEFAKALIAFYFIRKYNVKRILNALLIGAAIGTGFAIFENFQYIITLSNQGLTVAVIRLLSSIGDHTEWCAISAAGLVIARGNGDLTFENLIDIKFLRLFGLAVIIHTCFDWLPSINVMFLVVLVILTWAIVLGLIAAGVREFKTLQARIKEKYHTQE